MSAWSRPAPRERRGLGAEVLLRRGLVTVARVGSLPAACRFVGACGEDRPVPPPSPVVTAAPAPDELVEGEMAESELSAFGLPIPEGFRVESRSSTRVTAVGRSPLENVANYVRKRVDAKDVVTGPGKTIFEEVTIKDPRATKAPPAGAGNADAGEPPYDRMRVTVSLHLGQVRLTVTRARSPKPPPAELNEDQRWERLGVRKDGKPANPKKFE